jgi:hypothetical protein
MFRRLHLRSDALTSLAPFNVGRVAAVPAEGELCAPSREIDFAEIIISNGGVSPMLCAC